MVFVESVGFEISRVVGNVTRILKLGIKMVDTGFLMSRFRLSLYHLTFHFLLFSHVSLFFFFHHLGLKKKVKTNKT